MRGLFIPDRVGKIVLRLDRAESTSPVPDATPPSPACPYHPTWAPKLRGPQPRPVHCPHCEREAMERREEYARRELCVPVVIGGGVPQKTLPDEYRRKLDEKLEAHYAASGAMRPGSVEEDEALARIDELRAEEQRRDGKRGVPVFGKFENGDFVQYIDTRRSIRARSRLVRAS